MPETQNTEWKESWRDEYLKWICGFANANGGKIFIGKNDNGEVVGVNNSKRLMDALPNKIQTHLGIVCDVDLHTEGGMDLIEITVMPNDVAISYHGAYHYRSGSTKQELKGNALTEFLLKKTGKTWGDIIEPKATLEDIDINAVEAFKRGALKSKRLPQVEGEDDILKIFKNLRLADDEGIKRAALLLFGKDPRDFFIHAYLKIGRFGKSDTELLSQEVIESNAFELADKTLEILDKKYIISNISYEGLHRVETPEYPYEAIREALLNAIAHRQYLGGTPITVSLYNDKMIIWSYGTLPNEISIEELSHIHNSYPRNSLIADTFFKGGLIEAWGRGTLKIIEECKKASLPTPTIIERGGGIEVTIYKHALTEERLIEMGLNDRQVRAVLYIKEHGELTNGKYQKLYSVSRNTASNDLSGLVERNILVASGSKGSGAFYNLVY